MNMDQFGNRGLARIFVFLRDFFLQLGPRRGLFIHEDKQTGVCFQPIRPILILYLKCFSIIDRYRYNKEKSVLRNYILIIMSSCSTS